MAQALQVEDTTQAKRRELRTGRLVLNLIVQMPLSLENAVTGSVIWITGVAASGKSTFMRALSARLCARGLDPIELDGDTLRRVFRADKGAYDFDGRLALGHQYSDLCRMLAEQGHLVLIATIALFQEIHAKNRAELPHYIEVLMDTPLDVAKSRDFKGLYRRDGMDPTSPVVGLDWNPELPKNPHFRVTPDPADYERNLELLANAIVEFPPETWKRRPKGE